MRTSRVAGTPFVALGLALVLGLAACESGAVEVTTTTIDASLLTTTTIPDATPPDEPGNGDTPDTTVAPSDPIDSFEIISRHSAEEGETLYILIEPGNYSAVSFENFLVELVETEPALVGTEVFDDRAALDAALKEEDDRTAEELQALEDHHLVSLVNEQQVLFRGPLSDFDDFIIGS